MPDIVIRSYKKEDRPAVRDIAFDTALAGKPAGPFLDDRELVADILTAYFTDIEPQSSFVVESSGRASGYITGALDAKRMHILFAAFIVPRLILRLITSPVIFKESNRISLAAYVRSIFKGEFNMPDIYRGYPAVLHINMAEDMRGQGIGAKLMGAFLEYLKRSNVHGVHLVTVSEEAGAFFKKQGFELLYQAKRSCFRHILGKDVPLFVYGRRVD